MFRNICVLCNSLRHILYLKISWKKATVEFKGFFGIAIRIIRASIRESSSFMDFIHNKPYTSTLPLQESFQPGYYLILCFIFLNAQWTSSFRIKVSVSAVLFEESFHLLLDGHGKASGGISFISRPRHWGLEGPLLVVIFFQHISFVIIND